MRLFSGWKPFSRGSGYEAYRYVQVNFGHLTLVTGLLLNYVNSSGLSSDQLNLPTSVQLQSSTDGLKFQADPIVCTIVLTKPFKYLPLSSILIVKRRVQCHRAIQTSINEWVQMNVSWNGSYAKVTPTGLAYGRAFRILVQSLSLEGNENVTGITISMFGCVNPDDPAPIGTWELCGNNQINSTRC